jgi:acyl carrier protein
MSIKGTVKQFIVSEIMNNKGLTEIEDDLSLIDEGIIDSLGILSLLTFIEKTYSLKISEADLVPENFETIIAISELIRSRQSTEQVM